MFEKIRSATMCDDDGRRDTEIQNDAARPHQNIIKAPSSRAIKIKRNFVNDGDVYGASSNGMSPAIDTGRVATSIPINV